MVIIAMIMHGDNIVMITKTILTGDNNGNDPNQFFSLIAKWNDYERVKILLRYGYRLKR